MASRNTNTSISCWVVRATMVSRLSADSGAMTRETQNRWCGKIQEGPIPTVLIRLAARHTPNSVDP